jgi:hypothetical protein
MLSCIPNYSVLPSGMADAIDGLWTKRQAVFQKNCIYARHLWPMPVILATQEADHQEDLGSRPAGTKSETLSQKEPTHTHTHTHTHRKGWWSGSSGKDCLHDKHDSVLSKPKTHTHKTLYLWTWEFEFHIIFHIPKYFSSGFSNHLKETIPNSQAIQKR